MNPCLFKLPLMSGLISFCSYCFPSFLSPSTSLLPLPIPFMPLSMPPPSLFVSAHVPFPFLSLPLLIYYLYIYPNCLCSLPSSSYLFSSLPNSSVSPYFSFPSSFNSSRLPFNHLSLPLFILYISNNILLAFLPLIPPPQLSFYFFLNFYSFYASPYASLLFAPTLHTLHSLIFLPLLLFLPYLITLLFS